MVYTTEGLINAVYSKHVLLLSQTVTTAENVWSTDTIHYSWEQVPLKIFAIQSINKR